jgi:hypothetical protein
MKLVAIRVQADPEYPICFSGLVAPAALKTAQIESCLRGRRVHGRSMITGLGAVW